MMRPTARLKNGPRLDGVRVLVVDNTPSVRTVVTDILTQDGAAVTAVGSAEEALAALQGERPDVLLSALAMPGRGGYTAPASSARGSSSTSRSRSVSRR
jgi:CheY-like chemotaxis protein